MHRFQSTLAIVIRTRTYKENDLLITLLTPHLGKLTVLAKGAKNIKSSRLGTLQLGNIIKAHIYQKNDFLWLSESTSVDQFLQTPKNLTQLNLLFYILEIVNYFVADNQHLEGIFPVVESLIKSVNHNQLAHFIKYEIQFIHALGFGLPQEIETAFNQKKYIDSQQLIRQHLESIIERPLESNRLFH